MIDKEDVVLFFKKDKFAEYVGIQLLEVEQGRAKTRLKIDEKHLNGIGTVHGGVIFTLADFCFAVAANSYGMVTVAINVNISYMKAVKSGILFAEAHEISRNPKISTYTIDITDDQGQLIAVFQGMAYTKREKIKI